MTWTRVLSSTSRSSLIIGGLGGLEELPERTRAASEAGLQLFVLTDEHVHAAWGDEVFGLLSNGGATARVLVIPSGEASKSVEQLAVCWNWLVDQGARRNDVLICLGGGVVGDLGGFVASTYQRGISLWQIPTSLLAQVDSSVGGKTAINLDAGKNLVGSFYQPDLVIADQQVLATLPDEEFVAGLGEVVKYALLDAGDFFSLLEGNTSALLNRDPALLDIVVRRCIEYKADVIAADERDRGKRAVLNLGHTTAHALEQTLGYGNLRHGSAVGLGLLVAAAVSESELGLPQEIRKRTGQLLEALGLPIDLDLPPTETLLRAASRDKKVTATAAGFVGLAAIGQPVWGMDVSYATLGEALEVIRRKNRG